MRTCGQGFSRLEKFTSLIHITKPMTKKNYSKIIKTISKSAKAVVAETKTDGVKNISQSSFVDTAVSVDGC